MVEGERGESCKHLKFAGSQHPPHLPSINFCCSLIKLRDNRCGKFTNGESSKAMRHWILWGIVKR
jgi:hypothetical protein